LFDGVIFPFRRRERNMIELETLGALVVYKRPILEFIVFTHNDLPNALSLRCVVSRDLLYGLFLWF
jgi:hypothetical protein